MEEAFSIRTNSITEGFDTFKLQPIQSEVESYLYGMEKLIGVVQDLSLAKSLERIMKIVRHAARSITHADGASFVLRDNGYCFYADEDSIEPLWKGQRFPMKICIGGWAMLHQEPAIIPDVYGDVRIPYEAYKPTFVQSLVMTPIRTMNPIGAIGVYWAKRHVPSDTEVRLLQALADTTAVAMENVQVYSEIEQRVEARTQELHSTNQRLQAEIEERQQLEAQARRLSLTDELTGLHNRRSFLLLADRELQLARCTQTDCFLLFIDLDGLKAVNDTGGHEMGDHMIRRAAQVLRQAFTHTDFIARLGGDEFVVLLPARSMGEAKQLRSQLQTHLDRFNTQTQTPYQLGMSVGIQHCAWDEQTPLAELIARADEKMYVQKRLRRAMRETQAFQDN